MAAKHTTTPAGDQKGFTAEEKAAMRERAKEVKAEARAGSIASKAAEAESALLAKIAEMPGPDRALAERIHALVKANAPDLSPKLWYGMPSYARDGKVVCFFQAAEKFDSRYATFGFNDDARLDEGTMWPTAFALKDLTPADEARIAELPEEGRELSTDPARASMTETGHSDGAGPQSMKRGENSENSVTWRTSLPSAAITKSACSSPRSTL